MKKNIIIIIILACISFQKSYSSYDTQFSQFYAAPLYLGPSFAGAAENPRMVVNFRDQWPKIPGSFVTYAISMDHYIHQYKSGVGLLILRDQAGGGKLNTTNIAGQYSYNVKLGNVWHMRPGIQVVYFQKGIDYSQLIFSDQMSWEGTNPTSVELPTDDRVRHYDFASSVLFHNQTMWFGTSVDHLIKLNPALQGNDDYASMKYTVYGGAKVPLERASYKRDQHSMFFAFHFKKQGQFQQLDFGAYYEKQGLNVGLWYRGIPVFVKIPSNDAITLMLGYKVNKSFTLGYSYDVTISRLITHTGGAHEFSLSYLFNQNPWNKKRRKITAVPCPIF